MINGLKCIRIVHIHLSLMKKKLVEKKAWYVHITEYITRNTEKIMQSH